MEETGRRAGDPPALVADSGLLRRLTGWQPRHDDLEFIIRTAWEWERNSRSEITGDRRKMQSGCPLLDRGGTI